MDVVPVWQFQSLRIRVGHELVKRQDFGGVGGGTGGGETDSCGPFGRMMPVASWVVFIWQIGPFLVSEFTVP